MKTLCLLLASSLLLTALVWGDMLQDTLQPQRADSVVAAPALPADTTTPLPTVTKDTVSEQQHPECAAMPVGICTLYKPSLLVTIPAQNAADILSAMPGVVNANGSLHVRGGLADELVYFVDGIPATDPYSGKLAVAVPPAMIADIDLSAGALPARYGGTMSGVAQITTELPGGRIGGGLSWTNMLLSGRRSDNQWDLSLGGPLPVLKDITVGLSAQVRNGDDVRPCFMPDNYYVRDPARDVPGFLADTVRMDGAVWDTLAHQFHGQWMDSSDAKWEAEKQRRISYYTLRGWKEWDKPYLPNSGFNDYYLSGSIGYALPQGYGTLKLTDMASRQQHGEYDALWKYNLDGYGAVLDWANLFSASWRDQLRPHLLLTARYTRLTARHQRDLLDTAAERDRGWWQDYTFVGGLPKLYTYHPYARSNNPFGYLGNSSLHYIEAGGFPNADQARTTSNTWQGEAQIDADLQTITIGASIQRTSLSKTSQYVYNGWLYTTYLATGYDLDQRSTSFSIQDELALGPLSFAPGLRLDMAKLSGATRQMYPSWPDPMPDTVVQLHDVSARALSPRISAQYRLTAATSIRATYEQLRELPSLAQMTNWLQAAWQQYFPLESNSFFVFQKTVQFSAGIDHRFLSGLDVSASIYQRIMDPVVQMQLHSHTDTSMPYGGTIWGYDYRPVPYGRIRGLELSASWSRHPMAMALDYSLENGKTSNAGDNFPLDFDLRHKLTHVLNYSLPQGGGPSIGGHHPFQGIAITLVNNAASGFPYTHLSNHGMPGGYNGTRLPWSWTTDLAVTKEVQLRSLTFSAGIEVTNLFNRKNLWSVFPVTGSANDDGSLMTIDQTYPVNDSIPRYITTTVDTGMGSNHGNYTYYIPNPYYSPYADANGSGAIDRYERYASYVKAWHDIMDDPYNAARTPFGRAYLQPRLIKLTFGIRF